MTLAGQKPEFPSLERSQYLERPKTFDRRVALPFLTQELLLVSLVLKTVSALSGPVYMPLD